jgi:hypothetical protein
MEQMQDVQQRYIAELTRYAAQLTTIRQATAEALGHSIWDDHKDTYAINRRRELSIVD